MKKKTFAQAQPIETSKLLAAAAGGGRLRVPGGRYDTGEDGEPVEERVRIWKPVG